MAALLSWFVPGAGHLYLGRTGLALAAFLLVEGVFALGYFLCDGRLWEFLDPELRGRFATLLAPDAGNLGGWFAVRELHGFGPPVRLPWPEYMHLGSLLIAASGVLNCFVIARAHLDARLGPERAVAEPCPALAAGATWLLPGLGHFLQGRRRRGWIVLVVLVGLFALGTFLAEGSNLSRERHFYYWGGQALLGPVAFVTELVSGRPPVRGDIAYGDVGLLFASIAGLLNVLAMLDVWAWGEDRHLGQDPVAARRHKREAARS